MTIVCTKYPVTQMLFQLLFKPLSALATPANYMLQTTSIWFLLNFPIVFVSSGKTPEERKSCMKHAPLLDFEECIEVQAEVHDDFGIRRSKLPLAPPEHKLKHHCGGLAVYSAVTAPSGNSPRFNQSGQFSSPP